MTIPAEGPEGACLGPDLCRLRYLAARRRLFPVTPTARNRPPEVEVLGEFIARKLSENGCGWAPSSSEPR